MPGGKDSRTEDGAVDVVFAVPPFADATRPALGVSLLKAGLTARGFRVRVEYLNLRLAEMLGLELYQQIASSFPPESLAGEWYFADDVWPDEIPHADDFVERVLGRMGGSLAQQLRAARRHRAAFLEEAAARLLAGQPRLVGLTTTFHQTCACLALARRLKSAPAPPLVALGGANCEGEMGLQMIRSFPWVDFVCNGEGDEAVPALVERELRGVGGGGPVPGILERGATAISSPHSVRDLDRLPFPDFVDFFETLADSALAAAVKPELVIETGRGCWWGAKQHCTFCGLNGESMAFRSKSPDRAYEELAYLAETYGVRKIEAVDNILDLRYLQTLFPRLAASGLGLDLFYEVKANLRFEQLEVLRAGGMSALQPGIESFSNEVLRLMRKGCTKLQNIQLLRWCAELDMRVFWNLLAGFPGESPAEYQSTARLLPLLVHLDPPASCTPVRLDRFSPFFTQSERLGMTRIRPAPAYYYAFPLGRRELARLAYYFDFDYADGRHPQSYLAEVQREVQAWWALRGPEDSQRPRFDAVFTGAGLSLRDTRPVAEQPEATLGDLEAQLFFLCDAAQTVQSLVRRLGDTVGGEEVARCLAGFVARGQMIEDEGHYLSLAVFRHRPPRTAELRHESAQASTAQPLLHLV
jgi:ribosomal peptide maturation radical SAM protein 1